MLYGPFVFSDLAALLPFPMNIGTGRLSVGIGDLSSKRRYWLVTCPQRIFAEAFVGVVRRYARMTDRLIKALQSIGVTTNGADGANLSSSLAIPTTAKTLIRRTLELPLPKEGLVRIVGIDEWAWKKGSSYGTILVNLEQQRVVALLPERSVESSTDWFKQHPEVEVVSRDRGKIFRAAANKGAPQAKQIVDRFHLQKNFGEALEKFFSHRKRLLKKVAQQIGGKTPLTPSTPAASSAIERERECRHTERVTRHKKIWELFRAGYSKGDIARMVGVSATSVYRALEQERPPSRRQWRSTHHVVDPYVSYLTKRWNEGCHIALQLYQEVIAQGYTGSVRTIRRTVAQFRPHGPKPVIEQMITLQKTPSPRSVALMIVRRAEKRTKDQTAFIDQLCKSDPTTATAYTLAQEFGSLLRNLAWRNGKLQYGLQALLK